MKKITVIMGLTLIASLGIIINSKPNICDAATTIESLDVNNDYMIDIKDLAIIASNYNTKMSDSNYQSKYDINKDTIVDLYDLTIISRLIGTSIPNSTVNVTSVSLNKNEDELTIGASDALNAVIAPSNATFQTLTWTSTDDSVATVDNTGKVTAVSVGTATITAATIDGKETANCIVSVDPVFKTGNTPQNIANGGRFSEENNIIYYAHPLDSGKLYKMDLNGNGSKLCDDNAAYINVVDDWIYYSNLTDGGKIYKIKTDGTIRTKLNYSESRYVTIVDDFIYYIDNSSGNIFKMNANGTGKTRINDDSSTNLFIVGRWAYYINNTDGIKPYKIKLDGTSKTKISDDAIYNLNDRSCLNVFDNYVYYYKNDYYSNDRYIYRTGTDGGNKTHILYGYLGSINIQDNWIYYSNYSDYGNIYKASVDGLQNIKLTSSNKGGSGTDVNIIGNQIYYYDAINNTMTYKEVRTDGSNEELFGTNRTIAKIPDINITVNQYDEFSLPAVSALMNDGAISQVNVKWQASVFNTDTLGIFEYDGAVSGYGVPVHLALTVQETGNTPGNLSNSGVYAQKGDWIYYSNILDNNKLYKIKTDGTNEVKLSDDIPAYINVAGNSIYYSNMTDIKIIYTMELDGSNRRILYNDCASYLSVIGNWIYYSNISDGNKLYKVDVEGNNRTKLNDDSSSNINVVGNYIYYANDSDYGRLYKININGDEKALLNDSFTDFYIGSIIVSGDWVYYTAGNSTKLCKVRTDGSARTELTDGIYHDRPYFNMADNWIYYSAYDGIYRIMLDGTGKEILNDDSVRNISIIDGWIYYFNDTDAGCLYRIRPDGSEREKIG